ncbi:MAG TPA: LptA/OstA family protein [Thermoanaerobaculia bacterium]|nr:LptA/OstA family protein [Thermoanaerobaculia bacterium]
MVKASREIRKGRAIQRMRWALLAATLVAVGGVVALYVSGRAGRPAAPADDREGELEPTGELVTVGEGFERTFSEGDRPVFMVQGERYAVDRKGIVFLEGVAVTVYQEDGSHYRIEGGKARFDIEKRQGRLGDGVRLSAPGGFELETRALRVLENGRQVRSTSDVEFRIGDAYRGRAGGLHAFLAGRRFRLEKHVEIASLPGAEEHLRLEAAGLILDRQRNLVRTDGWAVLHRRSERLTALDMDLYFAEDERTLRYVRGKGQVTGLFLAAGAFEELGPDAPERAEAGPAEEGGRRIDLECELLTLLVAEDGRQPRRLDLEGGPGGRASLRTLGAPAAPSYRLTAPVITGWFEDGIPSRAEASGGVTLVMREPGAADGDDEAGVRRATGREATAGFDPEGAMTEMRLRGDVVLTGGGAEARGDRGVYDLVAERGELEGGVVLTDDGVEAAGERGVFDLRRDRGELFGRPAVVETERGRMEAPRLRYTRADGLAHGTGGVRARLEEAEESALGGTPLGRGDGPVWVEAEEGYFRDRPRTFLFQGRVRAWRGDDLLVADELRGDEPEDRLVATGDVRTLWVPEKDGPEAGEADAPLEVRAPELVYRKSRRLLTYSGGVVARQEGRTMACREMEVELAEGGGVAELVCAGAARVEDPVQGRTLTGERLFYHPDRRVIEVEAAAGGKVTMKDREGNVIEGPRMIYDLDADRVQVVGRSGETAAPAPEDGGAGER